MGATASNTKSTKKATDDPQSHPLTPRRIARITEVPVGRRCRLRLRLTRSGAGFLAMFLLLGVVAANPGLNLLLLLFGLGMAMLLFNAIVARQHVTAVEVRRVLPDVAAVGRPAMIRYAVTNHSRWTTVRGLWIADDAGGSMADPPLLACYLDAVPPGGIATTELQVIPGWRGLYQLGELCVASKFPFGMVKRLRRLQGADQLLVWPALWNPRFDWLSRAVRAPQVRPSRDGAWHPGTDEFFGIREYRPGDNTRWIHWRRSASFDRVMVREMAQTSPGHITLALETATADGTIDRRTLDDLVSAAASLACDALERGWHVGLIVNGRPHVVLPPAGGRAVRSRLLYELATLAAGGSGRLAELLGNWPGGSAWTGRAVLLHADRTNKDPAIEAAAGRLTREIGTVVLLGPDDLDRWFDRSAASAGMPEAAPASTMAGPAATQASASAVAQAAASPAVRGAKP